MAAPHSFTPAEWARIEPILDEVLDLDPPDRPAAIARACGADASLQAHVEALVAADAGAAEFLETPAAEYAAVVVRAGAAGPADNEPQGRESPGDLIGPYRLIREIGHGGMGRVFLATRADGQFEQQVALKLVRGAASGGEIHARFLRERQILARLEHPHIARLLDGGVTLDGRPYFAMEYVDGEPITAYCERRALDLQQRLELFTSVCDAVQYAHQNLVVHRDLKPSNTLVTPEGTVKLLDFGIAKVLHQEDHDPFDATLTRLGSGPMTPEYAAPEQVRGEPVTAATDVYALGALAYELLTGRGPHALTRLTAAEVERVITQGAVDRPSQAALKPPRGRDGAAGGLTPAARAQRLKLRRQLKGDLDTILLQALQKEPARRYATAGAFVEDIRRYQRGLPIAARRDSFGYRAGKFVRRNALGVGATVLVLASLVVGLIGTAWQARVASREAAKAREVSRFLSSLFEVADPARANAEGISARELLDRGAARIESELSDQPEVQAEMMLVLGRISRELSLFDRAQTLLDRSLKLRTEFRGQFGLAAGRTRGRASEDVAEVTTELARLALDRGRPDEAERLHRGALGMRRAVLGDSHTSVGTSMRDLADVLTSRGKYDEAEGLLRDALVLHEKLYGPKHEEIASDLEGLQSTLRLRGEPAQAIVAARRCLDMRLELLGTDHLDTATAMNNLAILLLDRWELAEAEKLYRQVLAFDLRRLGELHSNTATVTNNLAFVLRDRGQYRGGRAPVPIRPRSGQAAVRSRASLRRDGDGQSRRRPAAPGETRRGGAAVPRLAGDVRACVRPGALAHRRDAGRAGIGARREGGRERGSAVPRRARAPRKNAAAQASAARAGADRPGEGTDPARPARGGRAVAAPRARDANGAARRRRPAHRRSAGQARHLPGRAGKVRRGAHAADRGPRAAADRALLHAGGAGGRAGAGVAGADAAGACVPPASAVRPCAAASASSSLRSSRLSAARSHS